MSFCSNCGNQVGEGQICSCRVSQPQEKQTNEMQQQTVAQKSPNNTQGNSDDFSPKNIFKTGLNFFIKPVSTVREAVKSNSWKLGLIFMAIYILCIGVLGTFNSVNYQLKSYNSKIKSAQKTYDEYKDKYKDASTKYEKERYEDYMDDAKDNLDSVKKEKGKLIKSGDFYKDLLKTFWKLIINPTLYMAILILSLFVLGKVFNGNGEIKSMVAGVGMASVIYLISVLVIPLITKIPNLEFFNLLIPIVTYVFVLLVFTAFDEIYHFDGDKSVFAMIIAFAVSALITGLLFKGGISSEVDSSLQELNSLLELFN